MCLVGNELVEWDLKEVGQRRSMFDKNCVFQRDILEATLDYVFLNCGLEGQREIAYDVLMTEPLSNPNYCRNLVQELMFEAYGVQRVAFGVDGLFAMHGSS